jgi:hypothetical protein
METENCPRICSELVLPGFSGIDPEIELGEPGESFLHDVANTPYSKHPEERNPCGCVDLPAVEVPTPKRPFFGTRHPYLHHAPNDPEPEESEEEGDSEEDDAEADEDEEEDDEKEENESEKAKTYGQQKQSLLGRIKKLFLG